MAGKRFPDLGLLAALLLVAALVGCTGRRGMPTPPGIGSQDSEQGVVVDNQDAAMEVSGNWQSAQSPTAYNGTCSWAEFWKNPPDGSLDPTHHAAATARPELLEAGRYEVYAWWCEVPEAEVATKQLIWLCASRGYTCIPIYVNPQENAGQWNSLGTYHLESDADVTVRNGEKNQGAPPGFETIANGAVVIDAFRFVLRSSKPSAPTPVPWQPRPSPTP